MANHSGGGSSRGDTFLTYYCLLMILVLILVTGLVVGAEYANDNEGCSDQNGDDSNSDCASFQDSENATRRGLLYGGLAGGGLDALILLCVAVYHIKKCRHRHYEAVGEQTSLMDKVRAFLCCHQLNTTRQENDEVVIDNSHQL